MKAIRTDLVHITPATAKRWLETSNNCNRSLRPAVVEKYAEDMRRGLWRITHQGIAFYADGEVADGQHRLAAIAKSNMTIKMFVTKNMPKETAAVIDQNTPRTAHDAVRLSGGPEYIDKDMIAVVRYVLSGMGVDPNPHSISTITSYAEKHKDLLQLARSFIHQKKRNVTGAMITASYFCALNAGEPADKIKRFAEIMFYGEIDGPYENPAIKMREFLITNGAGCWRGWTRVETGYRLQRAIQLFCEGKAVSKLVTVDHYIYPTPQ